MRDYASCMQDIETWAVFYFSRVKILISILWIFPIFSRHQTLKKQCSAYIALKIASNFKITASFTLEIVYGHFSGIRVNETNIYEFIFSEMKDKSPFAKVMIWFNNYSSSKKSDTKIVDWPVHSWIYIISDR